MIILSTYTTKLSGLFDALTNGGFRIIEGALTAAVALISSDPTDIEGIMTEVGAAFSKFLNFSIAPVSPNDTS